MERMESPPSLETVYQAVVALYQNKNVKERENASQWLEELQKSVYSWKIADEMLHEKRSVESCYFAAQTMRSKIKYSFHELPSEAHICLRDSLFQHLEQVNDFTNSVIVTQLCVAIAVLSLQMSSWEKPVLDLINRFSNRSVLPLLEVLTVLPEEVNSKSLRLGENRRHKILNDLSSSAPTVMEFLKACLTNCDNQKTHTKVLRCFTSWVSISAITLTDISNNKIAVHAFYVLQNHELCPLLHEAATDCVCSILQTLEFKNQSLEFQTLDEQLIKGVLALEESYHLSVAQEDQDKCINYCRIFTELGESLLKKIMNSAFNCKNLYSLKVLDLVSLCIGHHDYEVAEITFNFWYRLSEELDDKMNDSLMLVFRPYIERLIESLYRHSRMEQDQEGLPDDSPSDFVDFRRKVSELMKDVVFIVGSLNFFRQMFLGLQAPGVTWDITEAALFLMQAVAKIIGPEENDIVPQVVKAILELDPHTTHIAVRHTAILLLGELCEWINSHSNDFLNPVLGFLLFCLRQPQLTSVTAIALKLISSTCSHKMTQHFNVLAVQVVEALKSTISNKTADNLLRSVSVILAEMPSNEIYMAMKSLCWVQIEPLRKINELEVTEVTTGKGGPTDPVVWLDRLATIFQHTNPVVANGSISPCSGVFTEIWPVLSDTCNKFQSDGWVMERCCRCLRFAVRCVGRQSCHLLQPIVQTIVPLYNVHRHSCFLYLGSILVDEFACEPQCVPGLLEMLQAFIQTTFQFFQEENGLKNHPDTVDDFFRLCARFLQRIPVEFLQCPALGAILECALMACSLDHKDANASTMKFFNDLLLSGRNNKNSGDIEVRKQLVSSIIQSHGKRLIQSLIEASVHSLYSYMLGEVADVFIELLDNNRNAVSGWLEEVLKSLPVQNSGGSITATQKQLEDFYHSLVRAQTSREITHLLEQFAKLYR